LARATPRSKRANEQQTAAFLETETKLSAKPSLSVTAGGAGLECAAAGAWTAVHASELEAVIDGAAQDLGAKSAAIDMHKVEAFDTYGAWLLERLVRERKALGGETSIVALPEHYRDLFKAMHGAVLKVPPPPVRENPVIASLEKLGKATVGVGDDLLAIANMLGAIGAATLRVLARPRSFRFTSAVHHLDRVGLQAVPIIALITFLIGGIIAQQGFFHFRKFGAETYVVDMLGILILREIGVLIVSIMVAGRSGSSYTAELGSMKMREEIDALRTMGLDPIEVLVLPRVFALIIALTMLTFLGSMAALYGGGLVAWLYGGMSPDIFIARLKEAISITHFKVGMIKAPFMALVIGVVACAQGFAVKGSAESLGLQTTASVVKSIFLVIVLDGLFAIFFASIDM
jgi:phospholipid/cholesterol/gamma-HCH transport system permease protein